jgi:galactokinase
LIGEHTDYNQGWVLPTLIDRYTEVIMAKREDDLVIVHSSQNRDYTYPIGHESKTNDWRDYIQGVTYILQKHSFQIKGVEIWIDSTIPEGAGLSSSAALIISILKCFRKIFRLPFNNLNMAFIGQEIENQFVGARVGIMDQMALIFAEVNNALFLDTKTLKFELIPLPSEMEIIIIHSGISHKLAAKEGYNQRRHECDEIKTLLQQESLRNLNIDQLNMLDEKYLKRARHVITENQRVHQFVSALRKGNFEVMGTLLKESHLSLRNDFEVSTHEIDILTTLANSKPEVYGSRLTGGGFGGAIIILVKKDYPKKIVEDILNDYFTLTGKRAFVL